VTARVFERARFLVLDLQAVAQGLADPVALDDAADKRVAAIRIAEIHAGPHPFDAVVSGHPAECRTLGGDAHILLRRGVVVDVEMFQRDEIGMAACGHRP